MGQINLYTAVEEMKAVSKAEGTFSIKFRKYNRQKQSGGDLVFFFGVLLLGWYRIMKKPWNR